MAIDIHFAKWLIKHRNAISGKTLMLGRLQLCVFRQELKGLFPDHLLNEYAEPLLKCLSRQDVVHSVDCSAYEGCTIVHDLGEPIEPTIKYNTIIDAGTIEHVFNLPQFFNNVQSWLEVGGHYIVTHPSNNAPKHGLYQISPDFWISVATPENGFELVELDIHRKGLNTTTRPFRNQNMRFFGLPFYTDLYAILRVTKRVKKFNVRQPMFILPQKGKGSFAKLKKKLVCLPRIYRIAERVYNATKT